MYRFIVFLLLLAAASLPARGQGNRHAGKEAASFIPAGYQVLKAVNGDLDLDAWPDVLLLLSPLGEDSLSSLETPLRRPALLLTGAAGGGFTLACRSDNLLYHYAFDLNFREALVEARIEKGRFSIDHYGGAARRWARITSFSYDPAAVTWFWSRDEYTTFSSMDPDQDPTEVILTPEDFGRVPIGKFDIYEDRAEWADPYRNQRKED